MQSRHFKREFNFVKEVPFNSKDSVSGITNSIGTDTNGNKFFITYYDTPETTEWVFNALIRLSKLVSNNINIPKVVSYDSKLSCVYSQFIEGKIFSELINEVDSADRKFYTIKALNEVKKFSNIGTDGFPDFDTFNIEIMLQINGIKLHSTVAFFKELSSILKNFPRSVLHTDFNTTNIIVSTINGTSHKEFFFVDYLNMACGPRLIDICSFIIDPQAMFTKEETDFILNDIFFDTSITADEVQATLLFECVRKLLILRLIGKIKHNNFFIEKSNNITHRIKSGFYDFEKVSAKAVLNDLFYELDKTN